MKLEIYAVCGNKRCGNVFSVSSLLPVNISDGDTTTLRRNDITCPKCGKMAAVPSGDYGAFKWTTDFRPDTAADAALWASAHRFVKDAIRSGMTPDDFREKAIEAAP